MKDLSRIPYAIYSDPEIYRREQERIFAGPHWSYVGLTAEIPKPGDFKTTVVGEKPVIVLRNRTGEVFVLENRCSHRGVKFCQVPFGNASKLTCPYHKWTYGLDGQLAGVPFKNGIEGQGGMPDDFKPKDHSLGRLKVAVRGGAIFASFDPEVPSFEDYLGPKMLGYFDRVFNGRELKVLGHLRQRVPANWKLMQENIKDPYHASLLHVFLIATGLFRADQKSSVEMDEQGRHSVLVSRKNPGGKLSEASEDLRSFNGSLRLDDTSIVDAVEEDFWQGPTVVMQTIFPSLIIQQQINSLATRHLVPRGPGAFDFVWTFFGYADDSEEMTQRRLRQSSLFGPAGYVSADDGEVVEMAQQGLAKFPDETALAALGGRDAADSDHMVTETAIRALFGYYQEKMGL